MKVEKTHLGYQFVLVEACNAGEKAASAYNRYSRDSVFMAMAACVAQRSPDPYRQVGCVAVREDGTPIAFSYNGLEPGADDKGFDWKNRPLVRTTVRHAEYNLVQFASSLAGATVYTTLQPCKACDAMLRKEGVRRVVYKEPYNECGSGHQLAELSSATGD